MCCGCVCMSKEDLKRCLPPALAAEGVGLNATELEAVATAVIACAQDCEEE